MNKFIFTLFLVSLLSFISTFSVPFSTCQNLTFGSYELMTDLSSSGICINITGNNIILNCQDNKIVGDFSNYLLSNSGNNNQILNCNFHNGTRGLNNLFTTGLIINNSNFYSNSFSGFHSFGSDNIIVNNSYFNNNFYGIYLQLGDNMTFENNILINNTNSSIFSQLISNLTIEDNTIRNNYDGMNLISVNSSLISNNVISLNFYSGITLNSNSDNLISSNQILNNSIGGIFVFQSENNNFTQNNIRYNSLYEIYFLSTIVYPYSNLFYDNTIYNYTKIGSNDWNNFDTKFNLSSTGNRFYNNSKSRTDITLCFDSGLNNNCDYFADIINSNPTIKAEVSNIFPFGNILLTFILLILFFIN